ncbi:AtrD, ABC-transporter [Cucurbitaria berberidis CBS 394.84]|uniref:AtrD, ABC-transporter n=1 Tax=Cucurbitaria berberidis CBS 394.84 TaxID=1168544 RepID=A0A9P4GJD2_9PLEO|nr:AtrD, ABC-transporter [Cucurbitaria berberidis CBS 394.84]KAF1846524.1 AtrD, ABC-transporter [Cucurbitaria berberidis CBS 394.84]
MAKVADKKGAQSVEEELQELNPQGTAIADSSKESDKSETSVAFHNVHVHGFSRRTDYQKTVASFLFAYVQQTLSKIRRIPEARIDILKGIEGVVMPGEMLLVLGKPGSGCTTLLKTLAGQTHGFVVDQQSAFNYQGISRAAMHGKMRGKCIYQAELDFHFPTLTMRETLEFAASARNVSYDQKDIQQRAESSATLLGLSRALDTKMGNDLIPGVSGGERKRASIAEILVCDSNFQCWDNSTRGLDSSNALDFVKTLRRQTTRRRSVAIVTLYQASEDIYQLFEKVLVLHEGHQIYFGPTQGARSYFTNLGLTSRNWSTTPDFLTSVTKAEDRLIRADFPGQVPTSADDFASTWASSAVAAELRRQVNKYDAIHPFANAEALKKHAGNNSLLPYVVSVPTQISLCASRGFLRLKNDLNAPISALIGNLVISLILGSMFYNMQENTNSFFGRGVLLFITIFLNTSLAGFECIAIWDTRPMIEKHLRYAFYRPLAEAVASVLVDFPNKLLLTLVFNVPLYFLANLRRTPGAFFTFYLFALVALLNGSMIYRAMGAMSRTLEGSQPPGAVFSLLLVLYSGFVVPFGEMRPWLKWFSYINPVYYGFESLVINEFSGRTFSCAKYIPAGSDYSDAPLGQKACTAVGSAPGSDVTLGDAYMFEIWGYQSKHLWRNLGIMVALMIFYGCVYVFCSEFISLQPSRGEILLFPKKKMVKSRITNDEESQPPSLTPNQGLDQVLEKSEVYDAGHMIDGDAATFVWRNLSYEIKIGKTQKRILDNIEGWVKPRTMTALMGASGAGKTSLLNVLADRTTTGVISGEKLVATHFQGLAFARRVGYVQQRDLHLNTMTVREALEFSALLRQPPKYSEAQKLHWVKTVISLLDIDRDGFVDAVIGVPGEGLNIEQRKRVTIGVELAARPDLLLFLDEPTSGLDSDSSMSIIKLLRRLADHGQAILCVIHQPSAPLLSHFDRLLLLSEGKSLYFGDLGRQFETMVNYFEHHGARHLTAAENPAEWMINVSNQSDEADGPSKNWAEIWSESAERIAALKECEAMQNELAQASAENAEVPSSEFAMSLWNQLLVVTKRAYVHDWRSPSYVWSKLFSTFGVTFINGVSFWKSGVSPQAIQNQVFSLFILTTIFGAHVQLIMKRFHENRTLYEIRERQSRTYSWVVFLTSNILVELLSQTIVSVIAFVCWYYPLGMWQNALALGELNERGGLTFLFIWSLMILFQTMSQMLMTIMPDIPTGINIANLLFMLSLIFSGVLVSPYALPRFWIFMYRATPLSYYISGIISVGLSGVKIVCARKNLAHIPAIPSGDTCASYLASYITSSGVQLLNPDATADCQVCEYANTDALLATYGIYFSQRWRNWGITVAYNCINIGLAFLLWWMVKVPRTARKV